jgi:hypothetical protein
MREQSPPSGHRRAWFGLVAGATLLAAACGEDADPEPAAGDATGAEPAEPAEALSVSIDEPTDGADVGGQFTVRMTPNVDVGAPDTGLHHLHLYYDGDTDDGDFDMVFSDTATVSGLAPGEHVIEAVIVNSDHSLTDARAEITVNVTEAVSGGTGVATTLPAYGGY